MKIAIVLLLWMSSFVTFISDMIVVVTKFTMTFYSKYEKSFPRLHLTGTGRSTQLCFLLLFLRALLDLLLELLVGSH
jgi:hypothetical protein